MGDLPPVVYLDSQDYSRLAQVWLGKGTPEQELLLRELLARQESGDALFAYSMPILSELLQYDESYAEAVDCKAEVVERLCRGWAIIFPMRLVALEISRWEATRSQTHHRQRSPLTSNDYWHPNVGDALADFRARSRTMLDEAVDGTRFNRAARRRAKAEGRKIDLARAVELAAPEFAQEYGIPIDAVDRSLVALLRGEADSEEASRMLFSAVARPTAFVHVYFRRIENNKDLPAFIGSLGRSFQESLTNLRDKLKPILASPEHRAMWRRMIAQWPSLLAEKALVWGEADAPEFGVTAETLQRLREEHRAREIPACNKFGTIMHRYVLHTSGAMDHRSRIEHSFGGDLVHALYADHVDLWRGDVRFSELFGQSFPEMRSKIVPRLTDLPAAIDRLNRRR